MKLRALSAYGLLVVLGLWAMSIGCGSEPCPVVGIMVSPSSATADHGAPSPGNQLQFFATTRVPDIPACAGSSSFGDPKSPAHIALTNVTWSVSDPVNVTISNTQGPTFGTATGVGATAGSVTVTAQGLGKLSSFSATATLVCK